MGDCTPTDIDLSLAACRGSSHFSSDILIVLVSFAVIFSYTE